MTASTGTCARNLPQHFNGCACVAVPGAVTAEVDIDLMDPWADIPLHGPADEPPPEHENAPAETVTVKDRHGDPVTLTPGVLDQEADYVFTSGQCLALAVATSEKTGWPVYLRMANDYIGRGRTKKDYVIHAMVQTPDGRLLDVSKVREPGDWIESGKEIDAQVVPADQARALLKTHMAAMQTQDAETAASFVDPVLARHGLTTASESTDLPAHLAGMTPLADHPRWPATADVHEVAAISDNWDLAADVHFRPGLKDAQFTLVSDFDLSRDAAATEPWEYTSEMDWGDDSEAEEHTADYEFLADAIEDDPGSVPPIVVVVADDGKAHILDGNHRAGLALSRGVKTWPAYITRDPGTKDFR